MALHTFDKRLLEFMYQLTLHQKLMNPKEMAQNITVQGKKVSERTIKRWLKYLKDNHYFTYYPSIRYEQLGLLSTNIILNGLKKDTLLNIHPYKVYLMKGVDLNTNESCFFINYLIPKNKLRNFKKFWQITLNRKLIDRYEILKTNQVFVVYSPKHKIIDSNGNLSFKENLDNSYFLNLLQNALKIDCRIELHKNIKKNPLIVPLVIEYFKDHKSSKKVWKHMKEKLGENIWDYVRDIRRKKKRTDGVGTHLVQKTINFLHNNFENFFQQIRVAYSPFYSGNINNFYLFLNLKDKQKILEIVQKLSQRSLYVLVNLLFNEDKDVALDFVTDSREAVHLLDDMHKKYVNMSANNRAIWFSYKKSARYWETKAKNWLKNNYHELFDPITVSWKYDSDKYLSELNELT